MKLKIGFIGAGKVGITLGSYFLQQGIEVVGYNSRTSESIHKASQITNTKPFEKIEELIEQSNLIWVTTTDDQIENVSQKIANLPNKSTSEKTFVHASGANTLSALSDLENKGFSTATAHPLLAFGSYEANIKQLKTTHFAIEKEEKKIISLLQKLGNPYFKILSEQKALYHLASVVLSNYLVTLSHISKQMYNQSGIDKEILRQANKPLINSVLENINKKCEIESLTGPINRGDTQTILKHLEILEKECPEYTNFYKTLGYETAKMIDNKEIMNVLR